MHEPFFSSAIRPHSSKDSSPDHDKPKRTTHKRSETNQYCTKTCFKKYLKILCYRCSSLPDNSCNYTIELYAIININYVDTNLRPLLDNTAKFSESFSCFVHRDKKLEN